MAKGAIKMKIDNEFIVSDIDIETFDYPKLKARVWNNLFGSGGSVSAECEHNGTIIKLYNIDIERNGSVEQEVEECQEMADKWNEDLEYNWNNELLRCLEYIAEYEQKQINGMKKHKDNLKKYKNNIDKINKKMLN